MWKKCARRRSFPSIVLVVFTCCAFVRGDESDSQLLTTGSEGVELVVNSDHSTIHFLQTTLATSDDSKEFASSNPTDNTDNDTSIEDSSLIANNLNNSSTTVSSNNLEDHDVHQVQIDTDALFENSEYTTFDLISKNTLSSDSSVIDENSRVEVQKCCPTGQALYLGLPGEPAACKNYEEKFILDVYWENTTHYWKFADTDSNNVTVKSFDPCKESKYNLDPDSYEEDKFFLLQNSSLYIRSTMEMHNSSQYCMDTIVSCSAIIPNTAFICTPHSTISESHYIYMTGLLISTVSLICLAIYTKKRVDIQYYDCKHCFIYFSGTMAASYFLLAILSLNLFSSKVMALIIYYLNIAYIVWLAFFCHVVCLTFKSSTIDSRTTSRLKWYAIASFLSPILLVAILYFADYNCNHNLANPLVKNIFYSSSTLNLIFYFVPIIATCIFSGIYLFVTFKKSTLPRHRYKNLKKLLDALKTKSWDLDRANIAAINKMYRRCLILILFMCVFVVLDLVFYLLPSSGVAEVHFMFGDVLFVLKGFFICFIFWRKEWCCKSCKEKDAQKDSSVKETPVELKPLNENGPTV